MSDDGVFLKILIIYTQGPFVTFFKTMKVIMAHPSLMLAFVSKILTNHTTLITFQKIASENTYHKGSEL